MALKRRDSHNPWISSWGAFHEGILEKVVSVTAREDGEHEVTLSKNSGTIAANLQLGADLTSCLALKANSDLSNPGVKLHGAGFIVSPDEATKLLQDSSPNAAPVVWEYRNGKDLTDRPRGVRVIDAFPFPIEKLQSDHPGIYQHLLINIKPERDHNARESRRKLWWAFGEPNKKLRQQLEGLPRFIATVETSKHRFFQFLEKAILPDNMLIAIASDDAAILGILSSQVHVVWALATGGNLGGNTPRYNKTRCFEPFPFPFLEEGELKQRIRDLGERLDSHRKRQQELHPGLTLTGIYNVLEKLRSGEPLNAKEKQIHDQGLVTVLRQIHDELDDAVLEAYGWGVLSRSVGVSPTTITDELLARLVKLNHERAAEEKRGIIRWLRPDYQNKTANVPQSEQTILPGTEATEPKSSIENHQSPIGNLPWPARLPDQVTLIRQLLTTDPTATPEQLSNRFGRKNAKRTEQIEGILETLRGLGRM